jgi:diguanylate cyclase (GGDEF)-like protein
VGNRSGAPRFHLLFLLITGVIGWFTTLAVALPLPAALPGWASVVLFLVVIAGARALAFPLATIDGDAEVSLDSAIFIAATACLGVPVTVLGVAVLLALDSLRRRRTFAGIAYAIYAGGLTGGLLAGLSRAFGFDHRGGNPWLVPLFGATFLVLHYALQTVQLRLAGQPWRLSIRRNVLGVIAEATLLPLAITIVLIWDPKHLGPLGLLGATYLLVNWSFNRLARLARRARRRALELEALNRVGRAISGSLEISELCGRLVDESRAALPEASALYVVTARRDKAGEVRCYRGRGVNDIAGDTTRGWLKLKEPLNQADLEGEVGARVSVPIVSYGETVAVLVAESRDDDAFEPDSVRLLEAIAVQAASAFENARLYALANIDGLTGLYCRRYFDQRVAEEVERARRFNSTFALVLLDLDDFKQLNDTFGHVAGDRALREVAAIAASQLRGVDLAARFGGEEFAFLLPRTSLADAYAVSERIRDAVASHLVTEEGETRRLTASLGVAGWEESGVDDPSQLVIRADAALYRAKAGGKNRVVRDMVSFELTPALAPVQRRRTT